MNRGTPKSSVAAAMPTNSETVTPAVGNQKRQHHKSGPAHAEAFANEIGESFAGDGAHASAHFLDQTETDCDGNQDPEEAIPVFRSDGSKRCDAAGIIAGAGGDHSRAKNSEVAEHSPAPRERVAHTTTAAPQ